MDFTPLIRVVPFEFWIPIIFLCLTLACNYVYRSRTAAIVLNYFLAMSISAMICVCYHSKPSGPHRLLHSHKQDLLVSKSHVVEMILVPPIIFNCAFDLDTHDFSKFLWQVVILAGPCFVFSSVFYGLLAFIYWDYTLEGKLKSALTLRYVFPMAGYLTAVDPITVGAVVDDLGLSHQLTSLLKFESLLCQAGAGIFDDIIQFAYDPTIFTRIIMQAAAVIGSVALGHVYGRALASILANLLYTDHVAEGGIRFVMIYFSYATGVFLGSMGSGTGTGTLCLVVFSITFNSCRGSISQRAYDDTKSFWSTLAFGAHGILTGLVGATAGESLAYEGNLSATADAALLYPLAVFSRFLTLLIFTPLLRFAGGFELEHMAMLVAAGIRGFLPIIMMRKPKNTPGVSHSAQWIAAKYFNQRAINVVIVVVVLSQLIQGLFLKPVSRWLGLQLEVRLRPAFLRAWSNRINTHVRKKMNDRKLLEQDVNIAWELIEKEIAFDFTVEDDGTRPDQKPEGCVLKKTEVRKSKNRRCRDVMEEVDARERLLHCYEAQVEKLWQSNGRTTSVATRVIENAIRDAAMHRRALNIDRLFQDLQPHPIWRRLAARGRKCMKKLNVQRFVDYFAIYESMWRWRLFMCLATMASFGFLAHISTKGDIPTDEFFSGVFLTIMVALEQMIRLYRMIKKFGQSAPKKRLAGEMWFWLEAILWMAEATAVTIHHIILQMCAEKDLDYINMTTKEFCKVASIVMISVDALILIQWPLIIGLVFRLALSEIQAFVVSRDAQAFEAISGLLIVTDAVMRLLAGRTLVQQPSLRKKLSNECMLTKNALEDKLIELLNRQGGAQTLVNIKTRQASRDVVAEVAASLLDGKRKGRLREFEYQCMETIVQEMRANLEIIQEEKPEKDEDLYANEQSTSEMGIEMLTDQLRQMEWLRTAGGEEEMAGIINQLATSGRIEKFKKTDKVIVEEETAEAYGVYILLNGFCRGITYNRKSDEFRQRLIYAGTMFGESGLRGDPYTETVVAASRKILTFWVSAKSISALPAPVYRAFVKQVVGKACIDHLRYSERYSSWSEEMLLLYVRHMLKSAKQGEPIPDEHRSVQLFSGSLVDGSGKRFTGTPAHPTPIDDGQFSLPLIGKGALTYYLVNRRDTSNPETTETNVLEDSLALADLESELSNCSIRSTDSNISGRYTKFKPLYTKLKKKQ